MAGGPETFFHGGPGAGHHIGGGAHVAGDQDRFDRSAGRPRRPPGCPRWKGPGGPFAVDADDPRFSIHRVLLALGDVVTDVVNLMQWPDHGGPIPSTCWKSFTGPGATGSAGWPRRSWPHRPWRQSNAGRPSERIMAQASWRSRANWMPSVLTCLAMKASESSQTWYPSPPGTRVQQHRHLIGGTGRRPGPSFGRRKSRPPRPLL